MSLKANTRVTTSLLSSHLSAGTAAADGKICSNGQPTLQTVGQSTICFATNATTMAKNINAMRIRINIHVCSDTKLRNDSREQVSVSVELLALVDRITAGVENPVQAL